MKIQLRCRQCLESRRIVSANVEVLDDGTCDVQAACGHRIAAVVQNSRFELLFDSAALALRDDYYREAVASFAAAVEAFWGFYVRVAARQLGVDDETVTRLRKDAKLSERRRGAMQLAHLMLTASAHGPGDAPPLPENASAYEPGDAQPRPELAWANDPAGPRSPTSFRNEVVHEGAFPTRDQAMYYGGWVYDVIVAGIDQLKRLAPEAATREIAMEVGRGHAALRDRGVNASAQTFWVGTLLPYDREGPRLAFGEALQRWGDLNAWDITRRADRYMREAADAKDDEENEGDLRRPASNAAPSWMDGFCSRLRRLLRRE